MSGIAKPPKKRKCLDLDINISPAASKPAMMRAPPTVNLHDWVDSPVLAKYTSAPIPQYYPGVIKAVPNPTSIEVELDREGDRKTFPNILENNDTVISNHSAPAILLKPGLAVCVKCCSTDSYYSVGTVSKLRNGPSLQCLIKFPSSQQVADMWVSRAAIRMLQPPWYDDLEDTDGQEVRQPMLRVSRSHGYRTTIN